MTILTYELAHRAATDAGNAHMRAGGRTRWDAHDARACAEAFTRLWPTDRPPAERARNTGILKYFIGPDQLRAVAIGVRGEERQHFLDITQRLADIVSTMPKVYEQDGKGDQAIAYLHYFKGSMDFYITERDTTDEQLQAFGSANLGDGPELGYISIAEIIAANVELDFHFQPKPLAECAS